MPTGPPVDVLPRRAATSRPFWAALAATVLAAGLATGLFAAFAGPAWPRAAVAAAVLFYAPGAAAVPAGPLPGQRRAVGAVACALIGALAVGSLGSSPIVSVLMLAVLGSAVALRTVCRRTLGMRTARTRLLNEQTVRNTPVFGTPGGTFDIRAVEKFGQDKAAFGVHGERLTARLLEPLLDLAGTRIVHSLPWPGTASADVDHAVVRAGRVVLVDSKCWKGGHYTFDLYGQLLRDGQPFPGGDIRIGDAADAWCRHVTDSDVLAAVVIHSADGRPVTVDADRPDGPVLVLTADEAADEIGAWLAQTTATIDRYLLSSIVNHDRAASGPGRAGPDGPRTPRRGTTTGRFLRGAVAGGVGGWLVSR